MRTSANGYLQSRGNRKVMLPEKKSYRCRFSQPKALSQADVFGLQTFRPLLHDERNPRPFIQRTISASGDGGKMDENVFAILALNEPKSFSCVKPLYGSCFFHVSSVPAIPGFLPYRLIIV